MNNTQPTTVKKPATAPAAVLVPGRNVFCIHCRAFGTDQRCHLNPPHTTNSWFTGRGAINDPAKEWCAQFKPRG